ncbi:MAG: hypothetical protein II407_03395, partial [Prevotella sp.]|nr:hypothetical protein [Prevotella sp.]
HCLVHFDNMIHSNAVLAGAMTSNSGIYVRITLTVKDGARCFLFENNQGQSSISKLNAKDEKPPQIVGQNDGLIVGFCMLETPAVFYAFDAECPNCFNFDQMDFRSYRLQMSSSHIASCNACKRKYDLGNGGMIIEGENGKKLIRYRAATTGPYGVLSVN